MHTPQFCFILVGVGGNLKISEKSSLGRGWGQKILFWWGAGYIVGGVT